MPSADTSKFRNNSTPLPRSGQIKIKVVKMIAKSLQNLTIGVARKNKKVARNGCCSSIGGLKSDSERKTKQRGPKRGDVKITIFKLIAKSLKHFATGVVAGKEKKDAGNGGESPTTTVIPSETGRGLKPDFRYEIKETQPLRGEIRINICKMIGGGGEKKVDGGAWAGIVPMGLESRNDR